MKLTLLSSASCIKCKYLKSKLLPYIEEHVDKIEYHELDAQTPEARPLIEKYRIMSLPFVLVQQGEVEKKFCGDINYFELIGEIEKFF